MFTQLQENQRQMNDAVNSCKTALETEDIGAVSDYSLKLIPDFREVKMQLQELDKPKQETVAAKAGQNGFENDNNNFAAFGEDSFGDAKTAATAGAFDDSFGSAFNGNAATQDARVVSKINGRIEVKN